MKAPTAATSPTDHFRTGQRVHIYAASHYHKRGTIREVRDVDAMGRVTVEMDITGDLVKFHACDLEAYLP